MEQSQNPRQHRIDPSHHSGSAQKRVGLVCVCPIVGQTELRSIGPASPVRIRLLDMPEPSDRARDRVPSEGSVRARSRPPIRPPPMVPRTAPTRSLGMEIIRRFQSQETNPPAGMAGVRVGEKPANRTHPCRSGSRSGGGRSGCRGKRSHRRGSEPRIAPNEAIAASPSPESLERKPRLSGWKRRCGWCGPCSKVPKIGLEARCRWCETCRAIAVRCAESIGQRQLEMARVRNRVGSARRQPLSVLPAISERLRIPTNSIPRAEPCAQRGNREYPR
jgi:hypothetical protein